MNQKDIKELAASLHMKLPMATQEDAIDFAHRFLAAYLAEQEPVGYVWYRVGSPPHFVPVIAGKAQTSFDIKEMVPLFTAPPGPAPKKSALSQYRRFEVDGEVIDPIDRLRAFCSFAMDGQDWLDVAPFFDALPEPAPQQEKQAAGDYGLTGSSTVGAAPSNDRPGMVCQYCKQPVLFPHVCQDAKVGTLHRTHEPDFAAKVVLGEATLSEEMWKMVESLRDVAVGWRMNQEAADMLERLANRAKNAINEMEIYKEENENLRHELAKKIPDGREFTDEQLTVIYNTANGIGDGKAPPITTKRIFTAMRAMIATGEKK